MISANPLRTLPFLLSVSAAGIFSASAQKSQTHLIADGFDYPVGTAAARAAPGHPKGYYVYRGYYPNGHQGEDWNGNGMGNTDLGDPVYSIGHGVVVYPDDFKAGWGNVVIIRHAYRAKTGQITFIDSLYGHLDKRMVRLGDKITRGKQIGTIGRGPYNMYYAHLHFEIRKNLAIGMNRSKFKRDYSNYHSPRNFLDNHRRLRQEYRRVKIPVETFLKSNPNQLTTRKAEPPQPIASSAADNRPKVSSQTLDVIKNQTDQKSKRTGGGAGLWKKILGALGLKKKDS